MSVKNHKTDAFILTVLGIFSALFFTVYILWGVLQKEKPNSPGIRTTYSTNVDATLICYTLFERLNIPVKRSEKMLLMENLDTIGVLFVLNPIIPLTRLEVKEIVDWVKKGGVLITTELPSKFNTGFGYIKSIDSSDDTCTEDTADDSFSGSLQYNRPTKTDSVNHLLDRDVKDVIFKTSLILKEPVNEETDEDGKSETVPPEELFADSLGVRMVSYPYENGSIVILSDSSFLSNGKITSEDNAVLAVNLVVWALSDALFPHVSFDEYHFGYGKHERGFDVMGEMLLKTSPGWAVLCLTLSGLLLLILKGKQFGPRRRVSTDMQRSRVEYINAISSTYRAAGANRLVFEIIYKRLRDKACLSAGISTASSNSAIDSALSARSGKNRGWYKIILDESDILIAKKRISSGQLGSALKKLTEIELEVM